MSARSVLLALVVPLAGCASDATRSAADADAFARDAESRAGVSRESHADAESRDASDGTIADSVHALLAEPMTEETAARIALVNNRDVRAELERLGVARADLAQASLPANPVFSGNVKFFDVGREIELDLAESFVELFLRPLRERLAASELAAREAEVKSALVDIAFEARRTLVSVRAAHDREELDRRALATADSSFDLMKHLHDAGNVGDPELTRQEIARDRAKLDLADAITESRVAR